MTVGPLSNRPDETEYPLGTIKIDKVWIYIYRSANGDEGVCSALMPSGVFSPLIAGDQARLKQLTPIAEQMAGYLGQGEEIILVEFTARADLRNIKGATS
ncbi:hypothetical protein ACVWXN_003432 [Bradyrhizobium sp. i1.4.4]